MPQGPIVIKRKRKKEIKEDREYKQSFFKESKKNPQSIYKITFFILLLFVIFGVIFYTQSYKHILGWITPTSKEASIYVTHLGPTANVYLDGKLIGKTPLKNYPVSEGEYKLKLEYNNPILGKKLSLQIPIVIKPQSTAIIEAKVGPTLRTSYYSIIYSSPGKPKATLLALEPQVEARVNQRICKLPCTLDNLGTYQIEFFGKNLHPKKMELKLENHKVLVIVKLAQKILKF